MIKIQQTQVTSRKKPEWVQWVIAGKSLPPVTSDLVTKLNKILNQDPQWQAFVDTNAMIDPVEIAVASKGGDAVLVKIEPGLRTSVSAGSTDMADFTYSAKTGQ